MPSSHGPVAAGDETFAGLVDAVRDLADALGGRFAAAVRDRTSPAAQRAILRAIGVSGLAPGGRPLALELVHRVATQDRRLPASGIALPLAVAAHEYDLEPQQAALEVVQGNIDLAAEAKLLSVRSRSAPARALLDEWLAGADDRFEANRVAGAELAAVLGEPRVPWVGAEERVFDARDAVAHAGTLVASGADLIRVRVPRDGELRDDLGTVAPEDEWPVGPAAPPPAGSERGLTMLRTALDEAGAAAGRFPRLAVRRVGLAAPELGVVVGFERVDVAFVDPLEAIEQFDVDPARALVDHALADALLARTGARLALGPGSADGSADEAGSSGRALALQALGRAFAVRVGFPAARLDLAACPPFAVDRGRPLRALVEVWLRAVLFPGHRLVVESDVGEVAGLGLTGLVSAWVAGGAVLGTVFVRDEAGRLARAPEALASAVGAARALATARPVGELRGEALELACATLTRARQTLQDVERGGLAAVGRANGLGSEGLERSADDPGMAWAWGSTSDGPGSAR